MRELQGPDDHKARQRWLSKNKPADLKDLHDAVAASQSAPPSPELQEVLSACLQMPSRGVCKGLLVPACQARELVSFTESPSEGLIAMTCKHLIRVDGTLYRLSGDTCKKVRDAARADAVIWMPHYRPAWLRKYYGVFGKDPASLAQKDSLS
eukprot:1159993-Pelagomonas_calceolata.AAC.1